MTYQYHMYNINVDARTQSCTAQKFSKCKRRKLFELVPQCLVLKSVDWFISISFCTSFTDVVGLLCYFHSIADNFHLFQNFGCTIFLLLSSVDNFEMSLTHIFTSKPYLPIIRVILGGNYHLPTKLFEQKMCRNYRSVCERKYTCVFVGW